MPRSNFIVAALILCLSCAHAKPADSTPRVDGYGIARSVVLCQTTESELRAKLGPPTRDGILHGDRIMSWIVSEDAAVHYLAVLLDNRGVVTDLYWDVPTEVPWTPANQCRR